MRYVVLSLEAIHCVAHGRNPLQQLWQIVQASNDTVVNRFATELHMDGAKMVVFGWQVKRRYVQADRVVVVWQSLMDPLEFRGQSVARAAYEEHGFYVIHCPSHLPKDFSLLETCYRVAPCSPTSSTRMLQQDSTAQGVTEFVLNWMAAAIPANHQVLEDSLFDQSLT
jgi:putative ubiquitin-RnfH superfamily antitoxin RatB of RatAB toxin-antitoxin module